MKVVFILLLTTAVCYGQYYNRRPRWSWYSQDGYKDRDILEQPLHKVRSCSRHSDCWFQPIGSPDNIWLTCERNQCTCDRFKDNRGDRAFMLEWTGSRCLMDEEGPCGESNGMVIGCKAGSRCISGKCMSDFRRNKATPLNSSCRDDTDCEWGLACRDTDFYVQPKPLKRCVKATAYTVYYAT